MKILRIHNGISEADEIGQCLTARGDEVLTCDDATMGRELLNRNEFEVVLLELESMLAIEFCRWVRYLRPVKPVFVIVVFDPSQITECQTVLQAGADDIWINRREAWSIRTDLLLAEARIRERQKFESLEEVLQTRAQQQVAIAALGQSALGGSELGTISDLVSTFLIQVLAVEFSCVMELSETGDALRFASGFGWRETEAGKLSPVPGVQSVIGHTLFSQEPIVFIDLPSDTRFAGPDLIRDHGIVSGVSVAIKGKGGPFGVLGAFTAQRRRFEEEDLRFVEGLANVLGAAIQRTRADLEQNKLQNQIQHLQRLESIGQLAAGLAHDYNNVLTIIHGHVTLVLGEPDLDTSSARSLKTALEAVERAAGLTRQLLAFSRKQAMQLDAIDLNVVIGNVTKLLDRILGGNIQLRFERGAALPAIEADAGMLEQVIINLAVNARDAMPSGGQLVVRTSIALIGAARTQRHPEARVGDFVCLTVSDTGCGMDESTLRRIFEPFFTTKDPEKGTGLGLATVYGIVKQHRGWVEVKSQVGHGTVFSVFLPSLGRSVQTVADAPKETAVRGKNETILLVEDEPTLRDVARMLLEDLGYQVVVAGSGMEALRTWADNKDRIDVLLTDLVMPDGVTGFELAQNLQQERPGLKVILTSGYDSERVMRELPASREFSFVQKPYRSEILARALRQSLSTNGSGLSIQS